MKPPRPHRALATPWFWAAAGALLGLALATVLFAPARWLADAVDGATAGHVILAQPRGTVWNGSALLVLAGGEGSRDAAALPGQVQWQLRPAWLGIAARVDMACCTAQPLGMRLTASIRGARIEVANGESRWPAAVLTGLGTPWNTLQPEGNLSLSTQGLSVEWIEGRLMMAGRAQLDANQISSRLSTLKPMGSYRITLNGGSTSTLQLDTLEGSLQLTGSGRWVGSKLRFDGVATAAPDREAALANLLNIIGRRSGSRSIITVG
ncbi:MAG: type II secretion system protein N [Comamonadaceae bacterium]|nr:MAG: type II secretion system protein N [Comamonadaceae bacterium]